MTRRATATAMRVVGLLCGVAALWAGAHGHRYWDDGSLSGAALLLGGLGLVAALGGYAAGAAPLERASVALGSTLFGLELLAPVAAASAGSSTLGASMYLGVCSVLVPLSLLLDGGALGPVAPRGRRAGVARLIMLVGLASVLASVWTPLLTPGGFLGDFSYWSWPDAGRGIGICLLALAVLALVGVVAAGAGRFPVVAVFAPACAAAGYALFLPVAGAFRFLDLGAGAWLGGAGGLLVVVATLALATAADGAVARTV